MLLDDGATSFEFDPTACRMEVEDFALLHLAQDGSVIASVNGGRAPRRTRRFSMRLTSAELASLESFWEGVDDTTQIEFTDTAGRIWNARWLEGFDTAEDAPSSDGWHQATVSLLLESVNDDTGRAAYDNSDHGWMSIQKSGAGVLYFPTAYAPVRGRVTRPASHRELLDQHLMVDAARYTRWDEIRLQFRALPDTFVTELEDYYVDTLVGATHPFSLVHFRDATATYRWTGGLRFVQDDGLRWEGEIELREIP